MSDPTQEKWSIEHALTDHQHGTNAVIDAAWATLPWKAPQNTEDALTAPLKGENASTVIAAPTRR
jgi:hypothetical protein